jgi:hypothetical protein
MEMPEFAEKGLEAARIASDLGDQAEAAALRAAEANQISDNFVLIAVVMASVLFFAGVGTKFRTRGLRMAMVALALLLLVGGFAYLVSLPQSIGV